MAKLTCVYATPTPDGWKCPLEKCPFIQVDIEGKTTEEPYCPVR